MDADTYPLDGAITEISKKFEDENVVSVCTYLKTNGSLSTHFSYNMSSELAWLSSKIQYPLFYGACVGYRKDVFEKLKGFNENFVTSQDLDLSKRASKFGKCVFARKSNVMTSPRRVEKGGTTNAILFHLINFFNFIIFKKPTDKYVPIR